MKLIFLPLFLCVPFITNSQITFVEVTTPDDFNMGNVMKSPMGEYFLQSANDVKSIYTSVDGVYWAKASLPVDNKFYNIQFYSDGTPVLNPYRDEHLIRRNGLWYTMDAGNEELVKASFIKDDTLFIYHEKRFSYSLDKGQSFVPLFTYNGSLVDHTARLWKFESQYVLLHGNDHDLLSVFNQDGEKILSRTLDLQYNASIIYSSCGYILFSDTDIYYLLQEDGLTFQSGPVTDILPQSHNNSYVQSVDDRLYLRSRDTVFRTTGCDFSWEFLISDKLIESNENIRFGQDEDIFLFNSTSDFFTVGENGIWEAHYPDIKQPYVTDVDEMNGYQFALTSNELLSKNINDDFWIELDSSGSFGYRMQYAPDGDLYVARENDILYSSDQGHSFSSISLPGTEHQIHQYFLKVLGNDILFFDIGNYGQAYYSVNNGQDWIAVEITIHGEKPEVKLVGNDIMISDLGNPFVFAKINVITHETTPVEVNAVGGILTSAVAILDDGTFFIQLNKIGDTERIYRYKFGEELEYLGAFPELSYYSLISSGNHLFSFGLNNYYMFNGETFTRYSYSGLPSGGFKEFILSENEYLYALVGRSKIYRSIQPLSFSISTKQATQVIDFDIYPNPVKDEITVSLNAGDYPRIDSYEIVNQVGEVLHQSAFLLPGDIRVAQLTPGIYCLVLKANEVIVGIRKFVRL